MPEQMLLPVTAACGSVSKGDLGERHPNGGGQQQVEGSCGVR